jgi:hypothetical protein
LWSGAQLLGLFVLAAGMLGTPPATADRADALNLAAVPVLGAPAACAADAAAATCVSDPKLPAPPAVAVAVVPRQAVRP